MKKVLARRTVLRGMGAVGLAAIALPPLEAMLNSTGTAYAGGPAFPLRFGTWYYGCGITAQNAALAVSQFFPPAVGPNWTVPPLLKPLTASRDYVTIVGGTQWAIAENTPHHVSRTAPLSGSYNLMNVGNKMGPAQDPLGPSIDRIVADAWQGKTPINSLEMAVSRVGKYEGMISFKAGQLFPGEFDPAYVFHKLFGGGMPMGTTAGMVPAGATPQDMSKQVAARKSVLDAVVADTRDLQNRVGKADAARLDAHLTGIRDLENQLDQLLMRGSLPSSGGGACTTPTAPPTTTPFNAAHEDFTGVHKAFADMLVIALACDLTRVFSLEFTGAQCNTTLWPAGLSALFHDYSHAGGNPDPAMLVMSGLALTSFGYLVDKLRTTPQGAGNLLDSMAIYCVNEYLNGATHNMENGNHPILLVGKANGALNAGQYIKPPTVENGSRVCLALLHAVGIMAPSFGVATGTATSPLPGILTGA